MDAWKKLSEVPAKLGYRRILSKVFLMPDGTEKQYDIIDQ